MGIKAAPFAILSIAVVAFLIAGYLLIPACALAHFGGVWDVGCTSEEDRGRDADRLALEQERQDIQRRIDVLEARIAARRCEGEHPKLLVDPDPSPVETERDRGDIAPLPGTGRERDFSETDAHKDDDTADTPDGDERDERVAPDPDTDAPRDLADLDGCWNLESELEISMRGGGGGTQPFPEWNVCFGEGSEGNGTQVMRSDDGMLCEGPIQGSFNPKGALVLTEEGDLVCNDGTEIFQRTTTCDVDESGVATCESVQPRTGGRGSFVLKRN